MKKFCALLAVVALVAFAAPAFAANPFMDVPMNHWAYDAVGQLAARGIISGYPDGTYKGNQPITRYEMASVIARGMAVIDMEKASKQDVEMLKRLVVEFKDELDALGVKVDKIDSRVAVLEENIGGWKLWGEFRFDVKYGDKNTASAVDTGVYTRGEADYDLNRYRLWMSKKVDDKITFIARLGKADSVLWDGTGAADSGTDAVVWQRYYFDVKDMFWGVDMMAGLWLTDWEGDDGLYTMDDAWFTDFTTKGFYFSKAFGMGEVAGFFGRDDSTTADRIIGGTADRDSQNYGLRVKFNFNEQFSLALNGMVRDYDYPAINTLAAGTTEKVSVFWANFGVNFTPSIAFKGAYFMQAYDYAVAAPAGLDDSPNAWKAILDVKQDALKFTSLWLEYAKLSANFALANSAYDDYGYDVVNGTFSAVNDRTVWAIKAEQKWNDKWTTFARYVKAEQDNSNNDQKLWTVGAKYYYTPALSFELAYESLDRDVNNLGAALTDDSVFRFRTHLKF